MDPEETVYTPLSWDRTALKWRAMIRSPYCDLTPTQKHVLCVMASYGKKMGEDIYPSQRQLAKHSGVSLNYICQTMKVAEREGWIIRFKLPLGGGQERTVYQLAIPLGVSDATTYMKSHFWLPPFRYELERTKHEDAPEKDRVRLVKREE